MSLVSAHVLDASAGAPAAGVEVRLSTTEGRELATAVTDADGRVTELGPATLPVGTYRVLFATGRYLADRDQPAFYPQIEVSFTVTEGEPHYHIPLLLSPYSYTTYRGS